GMLLIGLRRRANKQSGPGICDGQENERRADLRPYFEVLEELERRKPRRPSQTPLVYATSLGEAISVDVQALVALTRRYYDSRYNGGEWTQEMSQSARELREALRQNNATGARTQTP